MVSIRARQRFDFVDGLRCIAAGSVLAQHIFERTDVDVVFRYFSPGIFGVVLFFFVSGFIIPHSLRWGFDPDAFVVNRVFRIFPAYFTVLAILLLLGASGIAPWSNQLESVGMGALLANVLLVPEYVGAPQLLGVTWTLPIEFAWYGLCALIFAMGGSRWAFTASLAYSFAVMILASASFGLGMRAPLGRVCLVNAALLGYVYYLWFSGAASRPQRNLATLAFAVSSATALGIAFGYFTHPTTGAQNALLAWGGALAVFGTTVALPAVRSSRVLTGRLAIACGGIGYSVYLSHPIFVDLLLPADNIVVAAIAVPLLTFAISALIYTWVERPGVALGHALVGWLRRNNIAVLGGRSPAVELDGVGGAAGTSHGRHVSARDRSQHGRRGAE